MLWVIVGSCESVTGTFASFLDKITDTSYPDLCCTYMFLGKANILVTACDICATWFAAWEAYSSPLLREDGKGSWSFDCEPCKLCLGQQKNKWEDPQNMDLLKYMFLALDTEIANDHSTLMLS